MGKQPEAADQRLPQYGEYILSRREKVAALSAGAAVMAAIGYLFYHHWLGMILFAAAGLPYTHFRRQTLLARRRARLAQQFKHTLYSLSSSLSAGRSMENAFREAIADLKLLCPGTEVEMERELRIIAMRMKNGEPIEQAVMDLSRRAGQEDISNFADVLVTCKRTGGDLIEVVRRTSSIIGEKMEIKQEIDVLVAQKRLEMKVMMAAPFLFLAFLNLASPDFMAALYEGVGRVIATVALLLLLLSAWLIHKLMDIRV